MKINKQIYIKYIHHSTKSFEFDKYRFILVFLSGLLLLPIQQIKSEEIFLKCTGKYEINRGELIKPDWEISYLTINMDGLNSSIEYKGIKQEGRTLIKRNSYTITYIDSRKIIKTKYKIHRTYGTYIVNYPIKNRTLIGTCQKSRG